MTIQPCRTQQLYQLSAVNRWTSVLIFFDLDLKKFHRKRLVLYLKLSDDEIENIYASNVVQCWKQLLKRDELPNGAFTSLAHQKTKRDCQLDVTTKISREPKRHRFSKTMTKKRKHICDTKTLLKRFSKIFAEMTQRQKRLPVAIFLIIVCTSFVRDTN